MTLCNICLDIPFLSLPEAPPRGTGRYTWDQFGSIFDRVCVSNLVATPYYENIADLAASDQSCPICFVVRIGVQRWREKWEKLPNKRSDSPWGIDTMPEHEPLVLTQCANGQQGFIVWSNDPVQKWTYEILAVVGFAVDEGKRVCCLANFPNEAPLEPSDADKLMATASPLAAICPMRPFHEESGCKYNLDVAAAWVQTCCQEHEKCRTGPGPLPTRVLHVGTAGDMIRLVDGSSMTGEYSCLSYCWGNAPPFITTRETMGCKQSGFSLSEAPQTLQDAVTITRHLGLRYLWIDALCICQGDSEDWAQESSRMTETYSNAHVVIAADWGKDSTSGIFHKRSHVTAMFDLPGGYNDLQAILLDSRNQYDDYHTDLDEQPLNYRGWTLQERVLARRILHYTSTQMYFECEHGITGEEGPTGQDRFCSLTDDLDRCKEVLDAKTKRKWSGLVKEYGHRELTRPTDRLPAISGLAKLFQQIQGGPEYVAGLWSDDLISGLTWGSCNTSDNKKPFTAYVGPSWSWVGLNDTAFDKYDPSWVHISEVLGWTRKFKDENNRYGELESASIRIRGPVIQARPSMYPVEKRPPWFWVCTVFSTTESGTKCRMDHGVFVCDEQWRNWDLQILVLCGIRPRPDKLKRIEVRRTNFFGLVLKRSSNHNAGNEVWERVGCVKLLPDDLPAKKAVEVLRDEYKWKTLTLL